MILGVPQEVGLSVTTGCDLQFQVNRVDAEGNSVDFGGTVAIVIDTLLPTTVQASVSGASALFTIPAATANEIPTATAYQVTLNVGSATTPLIVGKFIRNDS